jgi:anhydro-N-acetylmuramic acid kinase
MSERPVLAIGIMSGTSLDGVDAALVRCESPTHVHLLHFHTRPYSAAERAEIQAALAQGSARALALLHVKLAEWAAEAVEQVLAASHTRASDLAFIAMHGQTVWHEPPLVSWQLGEPAVLAERFGVRVVNNFRARDVAAGGQGAPLVPMADLLLFSHSERPRVLLNLGGMANLTYVPRLASEAGTFAADTGPGVAIIDALARRVDPALPYDRDGVIAGQGTVREELLVRLLSDPFFAEPPPKSTGREKFGDSYADAIAREVPGPDGVATAVELTVRSVANAILQWVPGTPEIVGSGGGMRHPLLRERLSTVLAGRGLALSSFDDLFFTGDAKEAVAFALLGYLTIHGQPGNIPGATGAAHPRVLGQITPA